jgi:hypothetical protein
MNSFFKIEVVSIEMIVPCLLCPLFWRRKSICGYRQKPVPRPVIDEIIEVAKWVAGSRMQLCWRPEHHDLHRDGLSR